MNENEEVLIGSQLPENAFRELKEGETYEPMMSPKGHYPEVNFWSVTWGILMAVLFSAAAAYLGLKVGQVFEAAIPIAIIAAGIGALGHLGWLAIALFERPADTAVLGLESVGDVLCLEAKHL